MAGKGRRRQPRPDSLEGRLGERVEALRKAKGWTAPELAAKAGMGAGTAIRLEAGSVSTAIGTVLAFAHALGLSGEQLMRKVEDWTKKPKGGV